MRVNTTLCLRQISLVLHYPKMNNLRSSSERELGFGKVANSERIMNSDGTTNIIRKGISNFNPINVYHDLVTISWVRFLMIIFITYLIVNTLFALIYLWIGVNQLSGVVPGSGLHNFWEAFFFSSQSITTVGYGRVAPVSKLANAVAAFESLMGLMAFALATGLLYGRFSRPTAAILYSENCVVAPYQENSGLMFRIANARKNQLIEVEASVILSIKSMINGKEQRSFHNLELELKRINFLALSWTIVHPIAEGSPILGLTKRDLEEGKAEILILIKAIDDTYATQIYSRSSYGFDQILWGVTFNSVIRINAEGKTEIDLDKLNDHTAV